MLLVGSSRMRRRGDEAMARAISARCRSPPERSPNAFLSNPESPIRSSAPRAASASVFVYRKRARRSRSPHGAFSGAPSPSRPVRTTSRTEIGKSRSEWICCGTYPAARRVRAGFPPKRVTVPRRGARSPRIRRTSVVFPPPFGPMIEANSPSSTVRLTSSRTGSSGR